MLRATRRGFLALSGAAALGPFAPSAKAETATAKTIKLFLCGDVMLGRGIDQILPHPGDPRLQEPYMTSARGYVELGERAHGAVPKPVDFAYVWGDALGALRREQPDLRIINLETSITTSDAYWPKGINYKMSPANVPALTVAGIDCCVLANNHVLDFGREGLAETLQTLERAGIRTAGAGQNAQAAAAPAVLEVPGQGRVLVFAFAHATSGVPPDWAAGQDRPGVNLLEDLSEQTARRIAERALAVRRPGDVLIASIHWGGNWGYDVPSQQQLFAHALIDHAGFHIIHGHSSHHPKAIEVYRGRPILYGCGDFLNDYEGIAGQEAYRPDLALMYLPRLSAPAGELVALRLVPFQIRRFRLKHASPADAAWLRNVLDTESRRFGAAVALEADGALAIRWR